MNQMSILKQDVEVDSPLQNTVDSKLGNLIIQVDLDHRKPIESKFVTQSIQVD